MPLSMLASEAIGLVLRKRTAIPPLNALAYLRDVMARLPMQRASQIGELLPPRWQPA